ncbi:MAG: hypothetical protein WBP11_03055 [Dokdonella sp.]
MKARNLHPLLMACVIAMATAGCDANDSFAGNDDDYSQSDTSDGNYADGTASQYRAGSDQANGPSTSGGMQTVMITDQNGAGQPMQATSVTIPADWQAQGGISWNRSEPCTGNQMRFEWQASSPDGNEGYSVMPGLSWQVQGTQMAMNPCQAMPFRSAQDFLAAFVQQQRPGARILQYRARSPQPSNGGGQGNARVDSGQMLVAYQRNGQAMREVFSTSVMFTQSQGNVLAGAMSVSSLRAPDGRLDFSLAEAIGGSMKPDPQWQAETQRISMRSGDSFASRQSDQITQWHNGRMAAINARGAADRAAIRASTSRDIANIYSQINANTSATDDNIQRRTLEGIGSYNTYNDPSGGNTVQADIGYDRVIGNGDGTYTGTNDPYYNPAGSSELERVQ